MAKYDVPMVPKTYAVSFEVSRADLESELRQWGVSVLQGLGMEELFALWGTSLAERLPSFGEG